MRRIAVILTLLTAALGLLSAPASSETRQSSSAGRAHALERGIVTTLNSLRAERGLQALVVSRELESAAAAHSREMLAGGFFQHSSKDGTPFSIRVRRFYPVTGFTNWSAGENLLYSSAATDAATAIDSWMASPSHRKNMLSTGWREVGIAALHADSAGGTFAGKPTWVITMDFGARRGGRLDATGSVSDATG
jgi:uncharacterized protein YkwD